MNITSSPANAGGSTYAQRMQLRADLQQAADARKSEIAADKAKAMESPAFKGAESKKQQAKAKVQQLLEWLKIVRKLYANDPKGMAKALGQVFKDLKSAVKDYRDAGGAEMSASGEAAGAAIASGQAPDPAKTDDKASDTKTAESEAPSEGGAKTAEAESDAEAGKADTADTEPAKAEPAKSDGAGLYQAVVGEIRKSVGEDGLEFLKQVRSLTNKLVELVDTARGQAAIRKRDKEADKAFEDVDKSLKSLREEMDGMEQDIHRDAPTAGMKLDVAA